MEMEAQQSENEEDAPDFFSTYNDPTLEGSGNVNDFLLDYHPVSVLNSCFNFSYFKILWMSYD